MKYLRFVYNGEQKNGILNDLVISEIKGSFFGDYEITSNTFKLGDVKLLPPCQPSKVMAVGLNYIDHINEFGNEKPKNPVIFIKLPHTIIGPGDTILIPQESKRVDYEAELAIVIKKLCSKVETKDIESYILGATCLNDVTERNIQRSDGQWTRGKNFETFCPIGPLIVDSIDYNSLDIKSRLNGKIRQDSNTSNLIWNVYELISFISQTIPLNPGDIVTTGTPSGVGPMEDGDEVEVLISEIGSLKNNVKRFDKYIPNL
jgi:2-keto-4-pentenoate hydratase/2-oxohepta-3-ene-1,7-dioic acid hydratase in catechol pathway